MTNQAPAPFSCTYAPHIPELLSQLGVSIAISTYQAGKMVFLSPNGTESLIQLPRNFKQPMGIAYDSEHHRLALACKGEIIEFTHHGMLAAHYPKSPNTYDALFMPRITHHSGVIDTHDLHYGTDGQLFGVNTLFSCLFTLDRDFSFKPIWKPPFITELASEDRCHLNGMAMKDGKPKYVTAFNAGNTHRSWSSELLDGGLVLDVETNETLTEGLGMPHTPRLYADGLYVLESAKGELTHIDPSSGKTEMVFQYDGFLRGMDRIGDYLFIAQSKLRKNSSSFGKLPFAQKASTAGILILHLPTRSIQGEIRYQASVDEIYDLKLIPGFTRPNILNTLNEDYTKGLSIPSTSFWAKTEGNHE